jgi:ABC-type Mn2+/Zn2+ transport system ATPase subunit
MNDRCVAGESETACDHSFHCPQWQPPWPYSGRGHRDPIVGSLALEAQDLVVNYPSTSHPAVDGITLQVISGQRVALVGHNGAGKSTLLKAAAGLVTPKSGSIRVYGNPVGACHHRTAYLPQRADIDWHFPMSASDLVMTGRFVHLGWFRRPGREDRNHVEAAFERLGISHLASRQISELSGGQQQRILLARALVQEASLFLLDEPLNAVDEATRDVVDQVLSEHANKGGSVLMATHDLGRLAESFDCAVYLLDGKVQRVETLQECRSLPGQGTSPQKLPS